MHNSGLDKKKGFFFLISFLIASLLYSNSAFTEHSNLEYKIKAGYLYNFTKFVSWPEDSLQTFNICILGKDPFGSIINPIEKRSVGNKSIRLFRFQSINQVKDCHIVYFGKSKKKWGRSGFPLTGILAVGSFKNSLTVSESKKFSKAGGMVAFFLENGKVKLHINLKALRQSGLEVSAKLLEVAEVYEGESDE